MKTLSKAFILFLVFINVILGVVVVSEAQQLVNYLQDYQEAQDINNPTLEI